MGSLRIAPDTVPAGFTGVSDVVIAARKLYAIYQS
jgi:hypothetical protein